VAISNQVSTRYSLPYNCNDGSFPVPVVAGFGAPVEQILLIDDEKAVVDAIAKVLSHFGYDVTIARDGEEGLRLFNDSPSLKCVVTGISMPRMNGNEVARHIRTSDRTKIPVIAMTGCTEEAIERGLFNLHLIKPFMIRSLAEAIKTLALKSVLESSECQTP
jgi:two-component system response regulator VanR